MYNKPERYMRLEERVWENLNQSGILLKILARSMHGEDISNYHGVEFHDEFVLNSVNGEYMMMIQIYIKHTLSRRNVTPKIYRLTSDTGQQQNICAQIWEGISEEDILFIAQSSAEEYAAGGRAMDETQKTRMIKFLPALHEGRVCVELNPEYAKYRVYVRK